MVSKCGIDGYGAHLGLEYLVCNFLFVLDVCSRELIVVVVRYNISGEDSERNVRLLHELVHVVEGRQCEIWGRIAVKITET